MKIRLVTLLTIAIFSFPIFAQQNWYAENSGTNYPLNGISFVDENNGWVSGWGGILLHTTNSGQTWGLQNTQANYGLYCVFFTDLQNGWAAGYGGAVVHTTDGGETWTSQNISSYDDIYKLFFVDSNRGWAAGGYYDIMTGFSSRAIYNTTDGGNNWNMQYRVSYEPELHGIYFTDSNTGYATGGSKIVKTTNSGNNWSVQQTLSMFELKDIVFTNSTTGFVTGWYTGVPHYTAIFETTDGGSNWNEMSLGTNEDLSGLYFTDELNGWAVGNDGNNSAIIYRTTDGGNNWVKQNIPVFDALSQVFFTKPTKGWAVGQLGTIITYEGQVPVELVSFAASVDNNNVVLNWQTATEKNNSGFEIQRSQQSENSSWQQIGFVEGNGTTTQGHSYSFTDKTLAQGSYLYKLSQIDFDGTKTDSKIIEVDISLQPDKYSLSQNYPNPFNPSTTIEYSIPESGNAKLVVYNSLGEKVATLVDEIKSQGNYEIHFNASELVSGIYFYQLSTNNFTDVKKMILMK